MLSEILKNSVGRSSWANWVATHEGRAARETRELLDIAFLGLPPPKRSRLSKKIQRGDAAVIEATLYDLNP